jgi:hypothetical protein
MKKFTFLFAAVFLVFMSGCADSVIGDGFDSGVYFTDYKNSTLRFNNNSSVDLVVFNGPIATENVMGGIRGSRQGAGVKVTTLKQIYVVNTVTFDDYKANLNNLSACKITSSEMVYVDSDPYTVDVYGDNSGNGEIYVNNTTKYHVEVRTGNFGGPSLIVARPYENMTKYVVEGSYSLYPIVVVPVKTGEGVITGTRRIEDPAQIKNYSIYADEGQTVLTFSTAGISLLKPSSAVIKVYNGLVSKGAIFFLQGSTMLKSTLGRTGINEGKTYVYEVAGEVGDPKYVQINNFMYNLPSGNVSITGAITRFTNGSEYLITVQEGSTSIEYTGELPAVND